MSADASAAVLEALGGATAATPTLDDVFSLRKPKDLGAGLSSAGQSAVKGVLIGAAALVSAPIVGARAEGARGFAKGLGLGLASAIVLPVVGGAVAATQVVRGAMNTPEAVASASAGKRFDSQTRAWVAEDLVADGAWLGTTTDEAIFARAEARAEARGTKAGIGGLLDEASRAGGHAGRVRRLKLAAMLDVYVDWKPPRGSAIGTEKERANAFVEMMKPIAETLVNASFGKIILNKIGWVYKLEAEKFLHDPLAGTGTWLDLGLRSAGVTMQQKASTAKNKFATLKAGVKVLKTVASTEQDVTAATSEQHAAELRAKQQHEMLPHVIDALWSTSAVDIESTLRHVCSKTLHDASASRPRRAARAKALALLGDTFARVAPETNARDQDDVQVLIENAIRAAFEPQR